MGVSPVNQGKPIFECRYIFSGNLRTAWSNPSNTDSDGLLDFTHGFWLDDSMEITYNRVRFRYWIPPHKIEYITRLLKADDKPHEPPAS